jgi:hypothetical protein
MFGGLKVWPKKVSNSESNFIEISTKFDEKSDISTNKLVKISQFEGLKFWSKKVVKKHQNFGRKNVKF